MISTGKSNNLHVKGQTSRLLLFYVKHSLNIDKNEIYLNGHVEFSFVLSSSFSYFLKGTLHQQTDQGKNVKGAPAYRVAEYGELGIFSLMNSLFQF